MRRLRRPPGPRRAAMRKGPLRRFTANMTLPAATSRAPKKITGRQRGQRPPREQGGLAVRSRNAPLTNESCHFDIETGRAAAKSFAFQALPGPVAAARISSPYGAVRGLEP